MDAVISVAKDVLRRAARVGLEAAGEKIFGVKGWSLAKDVFTPVFDKLEEQFPALKALGTPEAEAAA